MSGGGLAEHAYAVALASLSRVGPVRLRALLDGEPASSCWARLRSGCHPADPQRFWRLEANQLDVGELWRLHRAAGIGVALLHEPAYPPVLREDPEAPAVLCFLGDPWALHAGPRTAIVGTRSATRYGLGVAAQLGAELAANGVRVVSGLASGIDGAAHEGACALSGKGGAPPIGVVAGGLDDPYPPRHARLWRRVAEAGVLVSECPVGRGNEQWRFPLRNRLLAALSDVVVVVECHARGGSLHTVAAADRRGRPVGAVPGSVRSPASSGTNELLAHGAFPVRDSTDVLVALSLYGKPVSVAKGGWAAGEAEGRPATAAEDNPASVTEREQRALGAAAASAVAEAVEVVAGSGLGAQAGPRERPAPAPRRRGSPPDAVWSALEHDPCPLDLVIRRTALALGEVSAALEELAANGRAHEVAAGWWCRA